MKTDYKKMIDNFESLMFEYRDFGAVDSEPRWVYKDYMRKWAKREKVDLPNGAREWQLISGMEGSEDAANIMSAALKLLTARLQAGSYIEVVEALKYYGFLEE